MLDVLYQLLATAEKQLEMPLQTDALERWLVRRRDVLVALEAEQGNMLDPGEAAKCMQRILALDQALAERIRGELHSVKHHISQVRTAQNYQVPRDAGHCIDWRG